jgi:hypothetical protein
VKRSRSIKLVLIGSLSAGALAGCDSGGSKVALTTDNVLTNNTYLPSIGYYHAPFRGWYAKPYNHYDPATRRYFYGGQWFETPHASITNISAPRAEELARAQAAQPVVRRGGFGSTGHGHYISS